MPYRALIVDDSRSARMLLGRMLEGFGLSTHAVESAEQALTWLQQARPDVIFMDHLMPGMDGFAAVKVIKSDPQTANIPVLMYTSQEGELYLSQARALGALGVLPKTLKSTDVADVLRQLNMLSPPQGSSNSSSIQTSIHPSSHPSAQASIHSSSQASAHLASNAPIMTATPSTKVVLPEVKIEDTREPAVASTTQLAHRIAMELSAELPALKADLNAVMYFWRAVAVGLCVVMVIGMSALAYLQYQTHQALRALQSATLPGAISTSANASPGASSSTTSPSAVPPPSSVTPDLGTLVATEAVNYGEVPLAGARLDRLRTLVAEQRTKPAPAVVKVTLFSADFCLAPSANGTSYELAPEEWPVTRCEIIGNPFGDALSVSQRESVAFASFVNSINNSQGHVVVQVQEGGRSVRAAYPDRSDTTTAGRWNEVAQRNQRVEFTLLTAP